MAKLQKLYIILVYTQRKVIKTAAHNAEYTHSCTSFILTRGEKPWLVRSAVTPLTLFGGTMNDTGRCREISSEKLIYHINVLINIQPISE